MTLEEIEKEYQEASAHYVNDCIAGWASDHGAKFIALAQHVRVFINACHTGSVFDINPAAAFENMRDAFYDLEENS